MDNTNEERYGIEYKMPTEMAKTYLGRDWGKGDNQIKLCQIVNDEFGLKNKCIRVIVE